MANSVNATLANSIVAVIHVGSLGMPHEKASVSWVDIGPDLCLSFLLKKETTVKTVLGVINLPLCGVSEDDNGTYSFTVLTSSVLSALVDNSSIVDPVGYCSSGAALIHKNGTITRLLPSLSTDGVFFQALKSPIKSAASSLNPVSLVDSDNDESGVLQIITVKQCKREATDLPCTVSNTERLNWRHLRNNSYFVDRLLATRSMHKTRCLKLRRRLNMATVRR
jgi:hypothetical protein